MIQPLTSKTSSPFIMIIFGATGDLAKHKLIPALFSMYKQGVLPKEFFVVGFSRRDISLQEFHEYFEMGNENKQWNNFVKHLFYQQGSFEEDLGYLELSKMLKDIDTKLNACITRFYYLATPPDHYQTILNKLVSTKLSEGCGYQSTEYGKTNWTRIIIEKPFGKDLETARNLDRRLSEIFDEKQIFRVDHYLGKETVQNMLAFRFANGIFEPVWNKNLIDHVQITFAEKDGIGTRGKFFDGVGELRDVAQNHLMQLIAAVSMEQPVSFTKEGLRDERAKVIDAIRVSDSQVVMGQYKEYKAEKDVQPDSNTDTFVAMKLFVNTPRFSGIPFYVRVGKKMPKEVIEVSVVFKQNCHILFKEYGCPEIGNVITFRIQPDEGISLRFIAKTPGAKLGLESVDMKFNYRESFGTRGLDAYEKILMDVLAGDQMLFNRSDELESSWELIASILEKWDGGNVKAYQSNCWGPKESGELIEKDGRKWLT
jgi:glucose-6-phosphate 1-dehydrogenase